jgi:hypothetical protein
VKQANEILRKASAYFAQAEPPANSGRFIADIALQRGERQQRANSGK